MINFDGFCSYGQIPKQDIEIAKLCLDAAISHAEAAGIPKFLFDSGDPKLTLYIYAIALHYYDNRGFVSASNSYKADEYTHRMTNKMRTELMHKRM